MRKLFTSILVAFATVSCSPQFYTLYFQSRVPSGSGVDMDGKSVAVVYLEDGSARDSLFNNCLADGLASGIEAEYFNGETAVEVFSIITQDDYSSRDSLVRLVLDMDMDVVLLVDRPEFSVDAVKAGRSLTTSHLYAYDSMDKADTVRVLTASVYANTSMADGSSMPYDAKKMGTAFSKKFINGWNDNAFSLVYFEYGKWLDAIEYAENLDWASATKIWLGLLKSEKNLSTRSYACYDLAVAMYVQKEYQLALDWLDEAKKLNPQMNVDNFRKMINNAVR